jgi:hypothetical protein
MSPPVQNYQGSTIHVADHTRARAAEGSRIAARKRRTTLLHLSTRHPEAVVYRSAPIVLQAVTAVIRVAIRQDLRAPRKSSDSQRIAKNGGQKNGCLRRHSVIFLPPIFLPISFGSGRKPGQVIRGQNLSFWRGRPTQFFVAFVRF